MQNLAQRARTIIAKEGIPGLARKIVRKSREALTGKYELDNAYGGDFFAFNLADSRPQAEWLAPKMAAAFKIKSMIDLGCATGHWVDAFLRAGVDARGFEGAPSARNSLICPVDRVTFADLRYPIKDNARQVDF